MKSKLMFMALFSLVMAALSSNGERSSAVMSKVYIGGSQEEEFCKSADSLLFSLEHIQGIIDEKQP